MQDESNANGELSTRDGTTDLSDCDKQASVEACTREERWEALRASSNSANHPEPTKPLADTTSPTNNGEGEGEGDGDALAVAALAAIGSGGESSKITSVPISSIQVLPGRRELGDVGPLMNSMNAVGLIQPIVLRRDFALVSGLQRLEAAKRLGRSHINATFVTDDASSELIELDENLVRNGLSLLDEAMSLRRQKELYETLNPGSRHGGGRGVAGGGKVAKDTDSVSFVGRVAKATGRGRTTVAENVRIGKICKSACGLVRGTPFAEKKQVLLALAKKDASEQERIAEDLSSGVNDRVTNALEQLGTKVGRPRVVQADLDGGEDTLRNVVDPPAGVDNTSSSQHEPGNAQRRPNQKLPDIFRDKDDLLAAKSNLEGVVDVLTRLRQGWQEGIGDDVEAALQTLEAVLNCLSQGLEQLTMDLVPIRVCPCGGPISGCADCKGAGWQSQRQVEAASPASARPFV